MIQNYYRILGRLILIIGACVLMTAGAAEAAGAGTIQGKVLDRETKVALPGANVLVKGTNIGSATDLNGNFVISNAPVGQQTIVVSYVGYNTADVTVIVPPNGTVERTVYLTATGIQGKTVVVTAQAQGQLQSINQQLSANKIVNVVSAEKMKQLPDADLAESIGRLPGVSLVRNAGQAYAVVIRGLSPQYNQVTIEGIPMASTNYYDRSIDLSLLGDDLVKGVEVSKTLTPDLNADALGGTVNLTLRTAQPGFHFDVWGNGGYNHLRNSYGNYKFAGSASDRFFGGKIGVLAQGNIEQEQLPSDQFNAGYSGPTRSSGSGVNEFYIYTNSATLTESNLNRHRYGASLILDYKSDLVNLKFYNIYDEELDSNISRNYDTFFGQVGHFEDWLNVNRTTTQQGTSSLQALFKLGQTELPISFSYTTGNVNIPNAQQFQFFETSVPGPSLSTMIYAQPSGLIKDMGVLDPKLSNTTLYNMLINNTRLIDNEYDARADWHVPFKVSDNFSGRLSVGGLYHTKRRTSTSDQVYLNLLYGAGAGTRASLVDAIPYLNGTTTSNSFGVVAYPFVDPAYTRTDILGYPISPGFNVYQLINMQNYYYSTLGNEGKYWENGPSDFNQNYTDKEYTNAAYGMGEFNIGDNLTVVAGARYQEEKTDIGAYHVDINGSNQNGLQSAPVFVDTKRDFPNWYPSINVKYKASGNVQILGAIYRSASLPSYGDISPLLMLQQGVNTVMGNPLLAPATAWNYDLGVSAYNLTLGLLTIDGFYKDISDLVYSIQGYEPFTALGRIPIYVDAPASVLSRLPGLSYYDTSFVKAYSMTNATASIPMNEITNAYLRGIEISWQTRLWYLPGLLSGLVLDLNYSIMSSNEWYPSFQFYSGGTFARPQDTLRYQTVEGSLLNQPKAIYNAVLGWDYAGFSARLSAQYQQVTLTSIDSKYGLENYYYGNVLLMDIALKQQIIDNLYVFANATNLNNHIDSYYFAHPTYVNGNAVYPAGQLPTSGQSYGWVVQLGMTFNY